MNGGRAPRIVLAALAGLSLSACEKVVQNMYDQPKYETFEANGAWPGATSARRMPVGTVASEAPPADDTAPRRDIGLLRHGRERYAIWCAPCHGIAGDGDGMVPSRGFPQPPSFHVARLRNAPDRHLFDVISDGYGVMYPYGPRVPVADRWAIVGYVRALQLSQHATLDAVPEAVKSELEASR